MSSRTAEGGRINPSVALLIDFPTAGRHSKGILQMNNPSSRCLSVRSRGIRFCFDRLVRGSMEGGERWPVT